MKRFARYSLVVASTLAGVLSIPARDIGGMAGEPAAIRNVANGDAIVSNTNDTGDGSLREAIANAPSGGTITFNLPAGPQTITLASELQIAADVTISGPADQPVTIDGGGSGRVIHVTSATATVTVENLTITGGDVSSTNDYGGGIWDAGTLTLKNCTISGNKAGFGGGIYVGNSNAVLNLLNSFVTNNCAKNGGGLEVGNGSSSVMVSNSTIDRNSTTITGGLGGGIHNGGSNGSATLTIYNSTTADNSAGQGGGIHNDGADFGSATLRIFSSTIANNTCNYSGGGIHNAGGNSGNASLSLSNCTVSGNAASQAGDGDGSAIFADGVNGAAPMRIANSTLSRNFFGMNGSAMVYSQSLPGTSSTVTLGSTILEAYSREATVGVDNSTVSSLGYNLANDAANGLLTATSDQVNTDPLLGAPGYNGGPTMTQLPLAGSPALDSGKNFAVDENNSVIGVDQRGLSRPLIFNSSILQPEGGDGSDIGAVEMIATPVSFTTSAQDVAEGSGSSNGSAPITLHRSGGSTVPLSVKVAITGGTAPASRYLLAPGALDSTFNPASGPASATALPEIDALALQPDGKLLAGGRFDQFNGVAAANLVRLNATGQVDNTFSPSSGINTPVTTIAVQNDGKILVGGTTSGDTATFVRLNTNGTVDSSFNPPLGGALFVLLLGDGRMLVGRSALPPLRLNGDGSVDPTFNPGPELASASIVTMAVQGDGKILVGGVVSHDSNADTNAILARLNPDGSLDNSFLLGVEAGQNGAIGKVVIQPDGRILAGGNFNSYNQSGVKNLVRLTPNGRVDTTFNSACDNAVIGLALQPDGRMVAVGAFSQPRLRVALLDSHGALDSTWKGAGADNQVDTVLLTADGKALIAGKFQHVNGTARGTVARLTGDLFASWAAGDSSDKTVRLPIVQNLIQDGNQTIVLGIVPLSPGATTAAPSQDTLTIIDDDSAPVFVNAAPPDGAFGESYSYTFTATGKANGSSAMSFTVDSQSGPLPPGLILSSSGVFSGVPTAANDGQPYTNIIVKATNGVSPAATSHPFSITIAKAAQAITFGALDDKIYGGADFTLNATASSQLPISYVAAPASVCTVSASTLHIAGGGTCTVTASQGGDSNYNAAQNLSRSFTVHPAATSVAVNSSVNPATEGTMLTFTATISSAAPGTATGHVQFRDNGNNVGAPQPLTSNAATVVVSGLSVGTHTITAEYAGDANFAASSGTLPGGELVNPAPTPTPTVTAAPTASPTTAEPLNISTRMEVLGGDNVLIAGFIITGEPGATKKVMIRGLGPSLAAAGVPNPLADPFLELHGPTGFNPIVNDNWADAGNTADIPEAFQPSDARESVIVATLTIGAQGFANYTAILRGAHGEQGVGLAEAYDLEAGTNQFANISTRGFIDKGDDVMIGGFILSGSTQGSKVLIRAIGPSLPVSGALADPTVEIHDEHGNKIRSNDNWKIDDATGELQEAAIEATTIPPSDELEAAVLDTFAPGAYTVVVAGKNHGTGVGLVEVYNLKE